MNYELLAILLLVVGCGLIVAEVFIPSGGMILILCVISFAASVWCAYKAWWNESTAYFTIYIVSLALLIPAVLVGIYKLLSDTRVGDRILLGAPDLEEVTPYQNELAHLQQLIGREGRALTPLMPGGMVSVDGERLHAFTEGMVVPQGSSVEIVAVRGTRVVVRPARPTAADSSATELADSERRDESVPPLDFDVLQG